MMQPIKVLIIFKSKTHDSKKGNDKDVLMEVTNFAKLISSLRL